MAQSPLDFLGGLLDGLLELPEKIFGDLGGLLDGLFGGGKSRGRVPGASSSRSTSLPPPYQGFGRIDLNKPRIKNSDGSVSTERTITAEFDGRHFNIPTIVDGVDVGADEAIRLFKSGSNKPTGVFDTAAQAESAARSRSAEIGMLITKGQRDSPSTVIRKSKREQSKIPDPFAQRCADGSKPINGL